MNGNSFRRAGVLIHPTSFPGQNGIGELGNEAFSVIDWIADAGMTLWQVLPLGPTGFGDSPYACFSAFAGNPFLISLDRLVEQGLLSHEDLTDLRRLPHERVEYGTVIPTKTSLLDKAFHNWLTQADEDEKNHFNEFRDRYSHWLADYALFMALKRFHDGRCWNEWPVEQRDRDHGALDLVRHELSDRITFEEWQQFVFFTQWGQVRAHANNRGIKIIGDMPIFVAYDSVDVWANRNLFHLDEQGNSTLVAGVPPDYFSETGQRWGNPLFNWPAHEDDNFGWWISRIKSTLELVDVVRIDHFRGFDTYWAIPAEEETAVNGHWIDNEQGPRFFEALLNHMGNLPLIAEDLGDLSYGHTTELRKRFGLPGMKVLQFAFGNGSDNAFLPHNVTPDSVIYTGTHDNNTTLGWWNEETNDRIRENVQFYVGHDISAPQEDLLRLAYSSVANYAIAPIQDLLGFDSDCMMNRPGQASGNWDWRIFINDLTPELANKMKEMAIIFNRIPREKENA